MIVSAHGEQALIRPQAGEALTQGRMGPGADLLFVNPPGPDDDTWIRCQHRTGQRAPDGTVWPQTALAQLAAMFPDRPVSVIDANARRLDWAEFGAQVQRARPRWYVTLLSGPTLQSDLQGVTLAKRAGARTVALGLLATPLAHSLLERYPALDYVLCGEPELTLRELVDTVDNTALQRTRPIERLFGPADEAPWPQTLGAVRGLAWRHEGQVIINASRPLIPRLDDLPLPLHRLLPLGKYSAPAVEAPSAVVVTGRGCLGNCCFCPKHIVYQDTLRVRSPESIVAELIELQRLGVHNVTLQANLFTACRDQVADLCRLIGAEGLALSWSCTSRPDTVDEELVRLMARAGCRRITWAIESGAERILQRSGKGSQAAAQAEQALAWSRAAGIHNWGSFLLGLPGETEESIRRTIALAVALRLERVSFDLAVPHPGTPFYRQAAASGWLRQGVSVIEGDPSGPAVVEYPRLKAAQLELWRERAYCEWAMSPGSLWGHLHILKQARAGRLMLGRQPLTAAEENALLHSRPLLFASE